MARKDRREARRPQNPPAGAAESRQEACFACERTFETRDKLLAHLKHDHNLDHGGG